MRICKGICTFGGTGSSSNIYLIDGELLVDTGLESSFNEIFDEMKCEGVDFKKIKFIVNTHGHYDHASANENFRKVTNAKVCAHKNEAEKIEKGSGSCYEFFSYSPELSEVDVPLENETELKTRNHTFKVIHTPGHTSGSICLYEPEKKILITGDTLFEDSFGRTDLPTGSRKELLDSLNKLQGLEVKLLLPGHGRVFIGEAGQVKAKIKEIL